MSAPAKKSASPIDFDLGLVLHIFQKNVIYIVLFYLISLMTAMLYIRYQREIFKSSAVIQITNAGNSKVLDFGKVLETENGLDGVVELMRSRNFLKKSISQLPIQVGYFVKGTFKVNEQYKSSPYEINDFKVHNTAIYGKSIFLKFKPNGQIEVSYILNDVRQAISARPNTLINMPDLQFKLEVNNLSIINDYQTNLKKDVFYFVINDPETIADPYIAKLEITVLNYFAKTLRISLEENNAKKTADIINKVATDFINYDVVKKSESAQKTIDFIDKQLSYVAIDLKDCEQKMQAFRKETKTSINRDFTSGYYYKIDNIEKELVQKKYQVNLIKDFIRQFNETGAIDVLSLQILGAEYKSDYFLMQKMRTIDDLNFKRERRIIKITIAP